MAFPELSAEARHTLDAPFTLKEVQTTAATLQTAKTLGPDGLQAEFYKEHAEVIVSHFHAVLLTVLEEDCIPQSIQRRWLLWCPSGERP